MRVYRKRKRDAGLALVRRWEPVDGLPAGRYFDHRILDARSLAMLPRIWFIVTNPSLLTNLENQWTRHERRRKSRLSTLPECLQCQ